MNKVVVKGIYKALQQNCKKNINVEINKDDFIKWHNEQNKICYYCEIEQGEKRLSIDRKDNNIGYNTNIIVLACDDCNGVKGNILTEKEMVIIGKLIMKKRWKNKK